MSHTFHTYTLIRLTLSWEAQDSNGIFRFFFYIAILLYIFRHSIHVLILTWRRQYKKKKCVLECIFWKVHVLYRSKTPHRNSSGRMFIQTKWSILHDIFSFNFLHGLFETGLCGLDKFSICNSIRIFGDKKAQFGKMHVSNRKAVFKNELCYK